MFSNKVSILLTRKANPLRFFYRPPAKITTVETTFAPVRVAVDAPVIFR